MTTEELIRLLAEMGYKNVRVLPDGQVIGTMKMMFTCGLMIGMDESGVAARYCYENESDAAVAARTWDGTGDPPGPWIKYKGPPEERLGPGAT